MTVPISCTEVSAFAFSRGGISIGEIKAVVAAAFEMPVEQLVSRQRNRPIAWARQEAMRFSRELTNHSLPNIGRLFGNLDHTTVIYALRACAEREAKPALQASAKELDYRRRVETIRRRLVSATTGDKSKNSTVNIESASA